MNQLIICTATLHEYWFHSEKDQSPQRLSISNASFVAPKQDKNTKLLATQNRYWQ